MAAVAVAGGLVQSSSSAGATLTVAYDASSSSYTLTDSGRSATFAPVDLAGSAPPGVANYSQSNGNKLTLLTASPSSNAPRTYVGLGAWSDSQASGGTETTNYDTFTYGNPTPASAAPRTGQASYDIDLVGYLTTPGIETRSLTGPGVFNADFLSGVFEADVHPVENYLVTGSVNSGSGIELLASGHLSSSDATFTGQVSFNDNSSAEYFGPISGRLYGPAGQEVGASFSGSNPNGGSLVGSFFGAQNGNALGQNLALTDVFTPEPFNVLGSRLATAVPPTGSAIQFTVDQLTLQPDGSIVYSPSLTPPLQGSTFTTANIVAPAHPNFISYQETVGGFPLQLDLYNMGPGNTELALTYMDLGIWHEAATPPTVTGNEMSSFVFGIATPQWVVSGRTGSAQYAGVAYGGGANLNLAVLYNVTGTSNFDVNFTAQTLSGSLTLNGAAVGGGAGVNFGTFTFAGAIPGNTNVYATEYSNTLPVSLNGAVVGQLQTQFYGPNAEEVGGPFYMVYDTSSATINVTGVAAAKRH